MAGVTVLVALGSNLGDRLEELRVGVAAISRWSCGPVALSSVWSTSPVDCPPDVADFLNAVVRFEAVAEASPELLLASFKAVEASRGRKLGVDIVPNAPRALDIDLLCFGEEIRSTPTLTLPHPRAVDRRFVMVPAAEVAPDFVWPATRLSIARLAEDLCTEEVLTRVPVGLALEEI